MTNCWKYFDKYITQETMKYYSPYFDPRGRAFPDISAHSDAPYFLVNLKTRS